MKMRFPLITPMVTSKEGMFGAERKHDIHTGIDLYTMKNSPVFAMEDATVVAVEDFTGPPESPWWLPTKAVLAEGHSGTILYGEIEPLVKVGDKITKDQIIGKVLPVLPENKVRPDIPICFIWNYMKRASPNPQFGNWENHVPKD